MRVVSLFRCKISKCRKDVSRDIANFKAYLQSLPFALDDLKPCIAGTSLASGVDVRFYDINPVQACQTVTLAIVPEERPFDFLIQDRGRFPSLTRFRVGGQLRLTYLDESVLVRFSRTVGGGQSGVPPAPSPKQPASKPLNKIGIVEEADVGYG